MTKFVAPGLHLLIDFQGAENLRNESGIKETLRKSAETCGARVLEIILHSFGEDAGITGVAILAESHISIHTWPEIDFAALDIFMCGTCDPRNAVPVLQTFFQPKKAQIREFHRGEDSHIRRKATNGKAMK